MINKDLKCSYPCTDVHRDMVFPKPDELDPRAIRILMVSEAPPIDHSNYFYTGASGSFFQTTRTAFQDAGIGIENYDDLTKMGIYLTTAIKCSKKDYLVSAKTIKECSRILGEELSQFSNVRVIMCMGDFAIKAVNNVFKERYNVKPIKPGSTYKIRRENHVFNKIRFMPSYTQTGDSFNIEKIKRQMIAEDIKKALEYSKKK